jgi:hypothetical protein
MDRCAGRDDFIDVFRHKLARLKKVLERLLH